MRVTVAKAIIMASDVRGASFDRLLRPEPRQFSDPSRSKFERRVSGFPPIGPRREKRSLLSAEGARHAHIALLAKRGTHRHHLRRGRPVGHDRVTSPCGGTLRPGDEPGADVLTFPADFSGRLETIRLVAHGRPSPSVQPACRRCGEHRSPRQGRDDPNPRQDRHSYYF